MDESSDGVLVRQGTEGVPHGGGHHLKFKLIPVDYCCPYYEITKDIQDKFCVRCGSEFKIKGEDVGQ